MFDLSAHLEVPPFSLGKAAKRALYEQALSDLTLHHYERCPEYRKLLQALEFDPGQRHALEDTPWLPVRLFKEYALASVPAGEITKTLTSSGTSGQAVSKIMLDGATANLQRKVLTRIVADFTGPRRLPLLVIDSPTVLKDRKLFSARGAGILGFALLGTDVHYALDVDMRLDLAAVRAFCEQHAGEDLLLFGFTHMIWEHLQKPLASLGETLPLQRAMLIHGGGWKKLAEQAVDNATFKDALAASCGIGRVHNYYGMVEQTGSIFMECAAGALHSSLYSEFLPRRPDFSLCAVGEVGIVQLLSLLPLSYPGHSLLSEDLGEILSEDACPCGRLGKACRVHGRLQQAELRGCGDTYRRES